MSNLGFHSLFHRVARFRGIRTFRFFIERNGEIFSPASPSFSVKTRVRLENQSLSGYDVLFFSVSFELDYINILRMLQQSSVPPLSTERSDRFPPIIIGGIAVTSNPDVLSPFADVIFIGDMECGLEHIMKVLLQHSFRKGKNLWADLSTIEGVWLPAVSGQKHKKRVYIKEILEPAHSVILTRNTAFSNMFLVEIGRGCRGLCRFCMTRCVTNPLRSVSKNHVLEVVRRMVDFTDRVGLIAPVLTDHRDLPLIVEEINNLGLTASFSSFRADDFDPELAELLAKNKQHTITFAPETGSVELREKIGKGLTNEALLDATRIALDFGIRRFRYYLMFGLPEETTRDIRAIGELIRETVRFLKSRKAQLYASINPFVPKKGTPLERHPLYPLDYYKEAKRLLEREFSGLPGFSYRMESLRNLHLHYYLSIGNSEIGRLALRCLLNGTFRGFALFAESIMRKNG